MRLANILLHLERQRQRLRRLLRLLLLLLQGGWHCRRRLSCWALRLCWAGLRHAGQNFLRQAAT